MKENQKRTGCDPRGASEELIGAMSIESTMKIHEVFMQKVANLRKAAEEARNNKKNCGADEKRKRGGQKMTHEEFVEKIANINDSVEVLGQYIDRNTRVLCKCRVCGYRWEAAPRDAYRIKCAKCAGCAKLTHEEFMQRVRTNHNNDSLTVLGKYVDRHTKVLCKCETCGTSLNMEPRTLYRGEGCIQCSGNRRKTHADFLQEMGQVNNSIEIVGTYVNAYTHIDCRCLICGHSWRATPTGLLSSGRGCPKCGKKKTADALRKSHDVFIAELANINPDVKVLGQYRGHLIGIECECRTCGHLWNGLPVNLLKPEGCKTCGIQRRADAQRKSHEQFISEVQAINNQIRVVGQYVNNESKIECQCARCGKTWFPRPLDLLRGHGCRWCARSQTSCMERSILLFLQEKLGKDKVLWRDRSIGKELDIYSPELHFAIEPGGWIWHAKLVEQDRAKRALCARHGIKIITIYDSFDGDRDALGFGEDIITYEHNLGELRNRNKLKECIKSVFNMLRLEYSFTEDKERELLIKAKIATTRKTKNDIIEELSMIHPNIRLIGDYEGSTAKVLCHCDICGHEWKRKAYDLIEKKSGCPVCGGIQKPVVNLNTGETFERIVDAAAHVGCNAGSISRVCNRKQESYNGQRFAFIKDLSESQLDSLRTQFPETFKY